MDFAGNYAQYVKFYWEWHIAIYLFVAGFSGACAIAAAYFARLGEAGGAVNSSAAGSFSPASGDAGAGVGGAVGGAGATLAGARPSANSSAAGSFSPSSGEAANSSAAGGFSQASGEAAVAASGGFAGNCSATAAASTGLIAKLLAYLRPAPRGSAMAAAQITMLASFAAIAFGCLLLVVDLDKPLSFYLLILHANPTSVMSVGVFCLSGFMAASFAALAWLWLRASLPRALGAAVGVLGLGVCAYTGFLISAAGKFELWASSAIPLLFIFSAFASALGFCAIAGYARFIAAFGAAERCVVAAELLALGAIFYALSGDYRAALLGGEYAWMLYALVLCCGLALPFAASFAHTRAVQITAGASALLGVLGLRFFVVYGGQAAYFATAM